MGRKENPLPVSDMAPLSQGARLRMARHRGNLTLTALATRIGYSKPYLSAIENGTTKPSRAILEAYASTLDLPIEELIAPDDEMPAVEHPGFDSQLDNTVASLAAEFGLSARELSLMREMLLDTARQKALALRASLDYWREPGPIPVCVIPVAGWQWREWPFELIVQAIDRAAAEAMQAQIRDLVVILPPEKIAETERALRRPAFAERLQQITCVPQTAALGLGHALLQARAAIGERAFAIILPDDRFDRVGADASVLRQVISHTVAANHVLAVAKLHDRGRRYGVAEIGPSAGANAPHPVQTLVEKPDPRHPFSTQKSDPMSPVYDVVGRYVLAPSIMTALTTLSREQGAGSRVELLDALQWLLDTGRETVAAYVVPSVVHIERDQTVFVTSGPGERGLREQ